jgi:hypothetical protein
MRSHYHESGVNVNVLSGMQLIGHPPFFVVVATSILPVRAGVQSNLLVRLNPACSRRFR